jgi:hypothetical protein
MNGVVEGPSVREVVDSVRAFLLHMGFAQVNLVWNHLTSAR